MTLKLLEISLYQKTGVNRIILAPILQTEFGAQLCAQQISLRTLAKYLKKTLEWESRLEDLPALAVSRASAYRRVIEIENRQNKLETERLINLLAKCSTILSKVIESSNSAKWIAAEIGRLITDIKKFESINLMNTNRIRQRSDSQLPEGLRKKWLKASPGKYFNRFIKILPGYHRREFHPGILQRRKIYKKRIHNYLH